MPESWFLLACHGQFVGNLVGKIHCSFLAWVKIEMPPIGPPDWVSYMREDAVLLKTWRN